MREAKRDRATKSKSFKCCRAKLVAHSMREHMWNAEKSMDRQRHSCHLARAHSRVCVCGAVCTRQTPIWLNKYANNNIYSTNRRTRRAKPTEIDQNLFVSSAVQHTHTRPKQMIWGSGMAAPYTRCMQMLDERAQRRQRRIFYRPCSHNKTAHL